MVNKETSYDSKNRALDEVHALAKVLLQYDLSEIEVENEGMRIRLCRTTSNAESAPVIRALPPPPLRIAEGGDEPDPHDNLQTVSSPFVGTFYRAPSQGAKPYVEVGQNVVKGQTLCIVEAMKLMNEIEADFNCKIVEVSAKNEEPVEYGQLLFKVQPT
ncbi:MAG: acetyl-CoA carboxylase biotin carboxyl carrier protein [Pseudomonadota bacterium]